MLKTKTFKKFGLVAILAGFLTACSAPLSQSPVPDTALGTAWGKDVVSSVTTVENLKRVSPSTPSLLETIHYSTEDSSYTLSNPHLGKNISLSVAGKWMNYPLTYERKNRGWRVIGEEGKPYSLVFTNGNDEPYELVVSVDGVDVINGQSASIQNRGYIVYPHKTLTIEGFRKSDTEVAQFVFSKPKQSYANTNPTGASSIDNTGVIGVAAFELYDPTAKKANAFPADSKNNSQYAQPPRH